jgi:nitrite reductase/ring-hydroxylating ferredoxin subunit
MAWVEVASATDVEAATMLEVEAAGLAVLLYYVGGRIYATSAICPHHAAWLLDGRISGDCIDCPRHMGRFDITTGAQRAGPASPPLPVYPVRVAEGQVWVKI